MNTKEIVDKYLIENFEQINKCREDKLPFKGLSESFRWGDVANEIIGNLKLFVDPEYVRHRFCKLRKKLEKKQVDEYIEGVIEHYSKYSTTVKDKVNVVYTQTKEDTDLSKGKSEKTVVTSREIKTLEDLIEVCQIDTNVWNIDKYVQNSWGNPANQQWQVKAFLSVKKGKDSIQLNEDFLERVNKIEPFCLLGFPINSGIIKPKASLLIPKQDAHWNKRDIDGKNSIEDRFKVFTKTLLEQLEKVIKVNNLEKITYLIGSDEFNSEWTKQTTHGTPQDNILTYQQAFEKISEFNIETIKLLRFYAPKVEVVLLNGNHDHNVGWHLATLLKQVFKKNDSITVNDSIDNTKVIPFHSTLVLLNHGDAIKPKDLAAKFPIIAKDVWSQYQNYVLVTGDKHHEVSHDFHGTMWYQVPQLSTAKSDWDDKKGFITSKAELLLFLFEEEGLSNIMRKQIK